MQHVRRLDDLNLEGCQLTISVFDGVHLGHQQLLGSLVRYARQQRMPAAVFTFDPHPIEVLRDPALIRYLTSPDERAALLGQLGVDYVITQQFDRPFSHLTPAEFLDRLQHSVNFRGLWVGPDFNFGHQRQGNVAYLEQDAPRRGFELHVVKPVEAQGEVISSTRIRQALQLGDLPAAERLLGRSYSMTVRLLPRPEGGGGLLLPAEAWEKRVYPAFGVYAARFRSDADQWGALVYLAPPNARAPELHHPPSVWVHLLEGHRALEDDELGPGELAFRERIGDLDTVPGEDLESTQLADHAAIAGRILGVRPR